MHHLVPGRAIGHQVDHGQAINEREILADRFAGALHNFQRQAHALAVVATPLVGALVGVAGQELVDEVTLGTHDLHAVVARLTRLHGTVDERPNLTLHPADRQLEWLERRDGRLDARRRHRKRVVGVAPGVQDLQGDLAASLVHRVGHHAMAPGGAAGRQGAGKRFGPAGQVGRKAAGHDEAHTALGPLTEIGGQFAQVTSVFEARVHRAHEHTVFQCGVPQIQR